VSDATAHLKTSESVGVDDIPGIIIKGCIHTFAPVLNTYFNQRYFPSLCKQAAIGPVLKKETVPLLAVTDQYPFSIIFPNYLNLLFMATFRIIYPYQHG
jgi:hypothetical protein